MELPEKQQLFEKHYHQLFDRVYRYIRVRLQSIPEAEDLVSEVILEGYRGLRNYDPGSGNLEQWLIGIAKYKLIQHWKKQLGTLDLADFEHCLEATDANLDAQLDQRLAWDKIMREIPERHHPLLFLKFVEDLTFEDIAKLMNKSPDAVRQSFSRLMRKLRLDLADRSIV